MWRTAKDKLLNVLPRRQISNGMTRINRNVDWMLRFQARHSGIRWRHNGNVNRWLWHWYAAAPNSRWLTPRCDWMCWETRCAAPNSRWLTARRDWMRRITRTRPNARRRSTRRNWMCRCARPRPNARWIINWRCWSAACFYWYDEC